MDGRRAGNRRMRDGSLRERRGASQNGRASHATTTRPKTNCCFRRSRCHGLQAIYRPVTLRPRLSTGLPLSCNLIMAAMTRASTQYRMISVFARESSTNVVVCAGLVSTCFFMATQHQETNFRFVCECRASERCVNGEQHGLLVRATTDPHKVTITSERFRNACPGNQSRH